MRIRATAIATVAAVGIMGATAQAAGLTQERYTTLESAAVLAEKADAIKSPAKAAPVLQQACAKLDGSSDALIASQHGVCVRLAKIAGEFGLPGCDDSATSARAAASRESCIRAIRTTHADVGRLVTAVVADRKVVAREVKDTACRNAVWTPSKDVAALRSVGRGFTLLERAVRRGSRGDLRRAARLIKALNGTRSSSAGLKQLRAACKPG